MQGRESVCERAGENLSVMEDQESAVVVQEGIKELREIG